MVVFGELLHHQSILYSVLVNCCIVVLELMSLVFDCFVLVNCFVVDCFEMHIELSVQQSVVLFILLTRTKTNCIKLEKKNSVIKFSLYKEWTIKIFLTYSYTCVDFM